MIFKLSAKLRIHFMLPKRKLLQVQHGPTIWAWWQLFKFAPVRTNPGRQNPLAPAWNLWIYTRWGACHGYFAIDRRDLSELYP